eukprot:gnl/TRDRNA2_/TRDRNA2_66709_c0_seq1.p1 gnl/TRDRNA2_/TRDRNA2_66709_c0~~gnl/TRDRNA2_/TRDRNA2_66709_c0_seq1.p1  ORF type:complete len:194 (+),score=36.21 gnl/TRDRNA2_/TRDRNA2_66709_c0_seq1:3-584(+)
MAWAFARTTQLDVLLYKALAQATAQRMGEFKSQNLADTAHAFATASQGDAAIFSAVATAVVLRVRDFNVQGLVNSAWAFVTVGEPEPSLVLSEASSLLDAIDCEDTKPRTKKYQEVLGCLAAAGQLVAGFTLLSRMEASGLLSEVGETFYVMLRSLLEACRLVGDSDGASQVQSVLLRRGFSSDAVAAASVQK